MDAHFWNDRFSVADYIYGTDPNAFIESIVSHIPAGPVLCLAEGEGRNAVFLARRGHDVTAVDQSAVGLEKANRLAAHHGVTIKTIVTDLATFDLQPDAWSGIIATFAHLPPALRRRIFTAAVRGPTAGGVFALEAYTIGQLAFNTGGPRDPELLMSATALRHELAGLEFIILREIERDATEGTHHTGIGAVVKILGASPEACEISDLKLKMRSKLWGNGPVKDSSSGPEIGPALNDGGNRPAVHCFRIL